MYRAQCRYTSLSLKFDIMSKIEWTNETWNPIIGCTKVSPGCDNCYAEKMACRLASMEHNISAYDYRYIVNGTEFDKPTKWNGETFFAESQINKPLKRKKPTKYFVCSMGDLFHKSVSFQDVTGIIEIIEKCKQHTFQILTKRPERMKEYFDLLLNGALDYTKLAALPIKNLWLGVTAENQEQAENRIPVLLQIPAKVHFVSIEPMLSFIDLMPAIFYEFEGWKLGIENPPKIDWVICGGESGHKARLINPGWVETLRDQCKKLRIPFFFKQWGEHLPIMDPSELKKYPLSKLVEKHEWQTVFAKIGKKKAGSLLDGKEYNEMPINNK